MYNQAQIPMNKCMYYYYCSTYFLCSYIVQGTLSNEWCYPQKTDFLILIKVTKIIPTTMLTGQTDSPLQFLSKWSRLHQDVSKRTDHYIFTLIPLGPLSSSVWNIFQNLDWISLPLCQGFVGLIFENWMDWHQY